MTELFQLFMQNWQPRSVVEWLTAGLAVSMTINFLTSVAVAFMLIT